MVSAKATFLSLWNVGETVKGRHLFAKSPQKEMKQRSERTFDGSVLVPTCTHKVKIQRSAQSAQSDQEVLHVRAWTPAISFRLKSANCPEKLVELELVARLQDATNMAEVPTDT